MRQTHLFLSSGKDLAQAEEEKTGPPVKKTKTTKKSRILKNVIAMCPAVSEAPVWADSEVVVVVEGRGEGTVTLTIGRLGTRLHFARSNFSGRGGNHLKSTCQLACLKYDGGAHKEELLYFQPV